MPAHRYWSEQEVLQLYKDFYSDLTSKQLSEKYGVDYVKSIRPIFRSIFGEHQLKERFKANCASSKTGSKNPMHGAFGHLHPRHVPSYLESSGYRMVDTPSWWRGPAKASKWLEHVMVACEKYKLDCLPKGMVVHHLDGDKLNNHPDNLQMMTRSEHMKEHFKDPEFVARRKVQRLSRKGVQPKQAGSARHPETGDDIV